MHLSLYLCIFLNLFLSALTYSIPDPQLEVLIPKGFRLSIPDEKGIVLAAFHVNINKPINLNQPGDYSADITETTDGRWVYENKQVFIDPGNRLNYWVHVQYGSYAFRRLGGTTISDEILKPDPLITTTEGTTTAEPTRGSDCKPSKTTVNRKLVCKGQLIFEDNFDTLNWTMWRREVRIPMDEDDAEFVSFQNREQNCFVSNNQLHIVPSLLTDMPGFSAPNIRTGKLDLGTDCTGIIDLSKECVRQAQYSQILPPVVSARIRTKDFFSFRYGKVEIRAKLPKGDWLFPLMLLEPLENNYGYTGYASGQMRVAFIRGNEFLWDRDGNNISGNRIAGGVVLATRESLRDIWLKGNNLNSHLGNDFHTYTLTWTDEWISLAVDGEEYGIIRGTFSSLARTHNIQHAKLWDNGDYMAPFDREFFLTLGVSVGGHADFPETSINGVDRKPKPWRNAHPKAELQFWNDRFNWLKTWSEENTGLHVDYVRVYAL